MVYHNNIFSRNLGFKAYELKDHLGNMRVTVSDVKIPNGTSFLADMITKNEYYPFGMLIDGKSVSSGNYRYGYGSTHEMDNEVKGTASTQILVNMASKRQELNTIIRFKQTNFLKYAKRV